MSNAYFDENRSKELAKIADNWLGVPFRHLGDGEGGVDCAHLVGRILVDMGILTDLERGKYYARDWYIHGREEILLDGLAWHVANYGRVGIFGAFVEDEPRAGDVLCMKLHSNLCPYHHAAIVLPGSNSIVHSLEKLGVVKTSLSGKWLTNQYKIFRLMTDGC